MVGSIRIDALPDETNPTLDQVFPAMGSATSRWTMQQLADLVTASIVDGSPETLNTLNELAAALGDDPDYAATIATQLALKANLTDLTDLPAGTRGTFYRQTPPAGWLKSNGAAVLCASYPELVTAIYCGDANNATANWGYRATTDVNPSTNRSITGDYLVLPDERAEFSRGWDDGRGVDAGRSLWSWHADELKAHSHAHNGGQILGLTTGGTSLYANSGGTTSVTGGSETRPRNIATLVCIKY